MLNALTSLLFVGLLVVLVWLGRRHEPHWVDRDGGRFISRARLLDERGGRPGRWQPVRGGVGRSALVLQPGFTGSRAIAGSYTVLGRAADDHHGHVLYTLQGERLALLRIPRSSPLVARLDSMSSQQT